MMTNSFLLFVYNGIAIIFASMIIFSLMRLYKKQPVAEQELKKEDKELIREKKKAEKAAAKKK